MGPPHYLRPRRKGKLTDDQVRSIRAYYDSRVTNKSLCKKYQLTPDTLLRVAAGLTTPRAGHPMTAEQRVELYNWFERKKSVRQMAMAYGITPTTLINIGKRASYRHVPEVDETPKQGQIR